MPEPGSIRTAIQTPRLAGYQLEHGAIQAKLCENLGIFYNHSSCRVYLLRTLQTNSDLGVVNDVSVTLSIASRIYVDGASDFQKTYIHRVWIGRPGFQLNNAVGNDICLCEPSLGTLEFSAGKKTHGTYPCGRLLPSCRLAAGAKGWLS